MAGVQLAEDRDDNGVDRPKNSAIVREKEVDVSGIEFEMKCV